MLISAAMPDASICPLCDCDVLASQEGTFRPGPAAPAVK
jgi:hypothetical protein